MRGIHHSPGQSRSPSVSQQALQDLINNPPVGVHDPSDAKFAGRDWRTIKVGEIIAPEETRFVQVDTSVEEATKLLITSGAPNVVLIRQKPDTRVAVGAFDYDDLIAYLLLVTELALPVNAADDEIADVLQRARANKPIPLEDIKYLLGRKEPPAFLDHTATLTKAVEIFGSGFHRIIVRKQGTNEVAGILSQLRLVRFFWENVKSFGIVEELHALSLKNLELGSHNVLSINGDQPLKEALLLIHTMGISSLPVLDAQKNVVGNISHVDAQLLTTTAALPLLDSSCTHFITVILSERGMVNGRDSYPVFHVVPQSTLAHTVAKLVATRSHRMWIVESPSPASSVPPSPSLKPSSTTAPPPLSLSPTRNDTHHTGPPYTPANPGVGISSSSLPGAALSGRLTGVVSLTDVLNLYARASGLSPADPEETRRRRRTSSSSSVRSGSVRASLDGGGSRTSMDLARSVGDVSGPRK
ncbi:Protein sds23 [Elsinoe australis]|uniref:Protein sds23 n=1 Tax=Elsinoe australis TaxID=40998 RepID=A0A2P8A0P1_9PEZI|nr:Protein sds23 [Elsinoe australis]